MNNRMNTALGAGLLILGIILIIFGINAAQSFSSEVSEAFTGSPSNRSMWLLGLGIVSGVVGLVMLFMRGSRRS